MGREFTGLSKSLQGAICNSLIYLLDLGLNPYSGLLLEVHYMVLRCVHYIFFTLLA